MKSVTVDIAPSDSDVEDLEHPSVNTKEIYEEAKLIAYEMELENVKEEKRKREGYKRATRALKTYMMTHDSEIKEWDSLVVKLV